MRSWAIGFLILASAGCGDGGRTCSCRAKTCTNQLSARFLPVEGATSARLCLDLGICAEFTIESGACAIDPQYADGGGCIVEADGHIVATMIMAAVPDADDAHGATLSQLDMNDAVRFESTRTFYFEPEYLCTPSNCGSPGDVCYTHTVSMDAT